MILHKTYSTILISCLDYTMVTILLFFVRKLLCTTIEISQIEYASFETT